MAMPQYRKFPDEYTTPWEWEDALAKFKRGDKVIYARLDKDEAERGIFSRYAGRNKDGDLMVTVGCDEGFFWSVPFTCCSLAPSEVM